MQAGAVMKVAWAAAALSALAAAAFIAAHHPLSSVTAVLALAAWFVFAYRRPALWPFVLPAALPAMNLSPWTGWIVFEEFDVLVLGAVAAGYARFACHSAERPPPLHGWRKWVPVLVAAITLHGLWRGIADAGDWSFGWFQGYADPLNSLRVGKSVLYALLLLPLVRRELHAGRDLAFRHFALGMLAGATVVSLAVLWERAAYPGLFDASAPYRTTALFWEMHVGGAAIDAYLALCTPFVAWALWSARTKWQWAAAALLAIIWCYVCLTTFSRGVYLGVAVPLLVLGLLLPFGDGRRWRPAARAAAFALAAAGVVALVLEAWGYGAAGLALLAMGAGLWLAQRRRTDGRGWRTTAAGLLALALIFEAVAMLGSGSFMFSRVVNSERDYESRTAHWLRGIGLLHGTGDWLFGLGLGRLPSHYDRFARGGEFPGAVRLVEAAHGPTSVEVLGPRTIADLGGLHGLTQRVTLHAEYRIRFDVRTERRADVLVRVCELHLLYDRACQVTVVRLRAADTASWRRLLLQLNGPPLTTGRWYAPRHGVLTLSVLNAGGSAEFDNVALETADGDQLLENGDFSASLARWLPAAQYHFLPWHIDNLYLELLIERGIVGLLAFVGLVGAVLWRLLRQPHRRDDAAPFVVASLCGVLCVGVVSSVLDVPRVAFLMWLIVLFAVQPNACPGRYQSCSLRRRTPHTPPNASAARASEPGSGTPVPGGGATVPATASNFT